MLQTYLSIYSPKSHLQASASKHQTRNYILLIQVSSVYKINAKYLRITCYGKMLGVLGRGINYEEENTKFDTNKNMKKAKIFNTETSAASLCVHYLK